MPNNVRIHTEVTGNAKGEIKGLQDGWRTFQKSGKEGLAIGVGVAAASKAFSLLDTAISTGIDAIGSSIDAASNLNETMTKSEVIFGNNSDAVEKWADDASGAFGQSKRAALDAASGFAGLFKTVGLGIDQSTEMAEKLTKLGSDLASFFNTDVDSALGALKSGLNGEAEPLRRFNVFLSETAVSAKLAEMGVKKTGGAFTEAQKATARYALIMEQTTDAQGDFARTSDGLANSQRTLSAEVEDLEAAFGQRLLPVMQEVVKVARDDLVPALDDMAGEGGLFDEIGKSAARFEVTLNAIPEAGQNLHRLFTGERFVGEELAETLDHVSSETIPDFVSSSREMGRGLDRVGDKAHDTRGQVSKLTSKTEDLANEFKDAASWAEKAGDAIAEAAYGPEELALKFGDARRELRENETELERVRKKLKKLHEDGKPVPKELRERFYDLRGEVIEGKKEVIRLGTKLVGTGQISMADLRKQMSLLDIRIDAASGSASALYQKLLEVRSLSDFGTSYDNGKQGIGGRAIGGAVQSGTTYLVGEKGPELFSPSMSGYIVPNDQLQGGTPASMTPAWGSSSPVVVNLTVSTPLMTPGSAEALAQAITPHVAKAMQRQQLIPRR